MKIIKLIQYGVIAILLYFVMCNIVIYIYAQQKPESDADTMVILGAKVIHTPAVAHPAHQFVYANHVLPLGKTVVVTTDFHLLRAIILAKRSGLTDVSGLSAGIGFDNKDKLIALWREPLALMNSLLFDHPKSNAFKTPTSP